MVDLSYLEKFTKGNTQKMEKYISMYLNTAPDAFKKMEQNIKDKAWQDLAINAHSLKPQADFIGILQLKKALVEIEQKVKAGKYNGLETLVKNANAFNLESEVFLRNYLKTAQ